ncbi:hypothetical protein [Streptomyces sp. NPDC023588]|uniref:hypothetical protein n=1 Tax=Streptomyces sp. NPDC023588 TaxID=3154907 RepID=UPI0033FBC6B4
MTGFRQLNPQGVGVVIQAEHAWLTLRGVHAIGAHHHDLTPLALAEHLPPVAVVSFAEVLGAVFSVPQGAGVAKADAKLRSPVRGVVLGVPPGWL